jgi:hypothetical protein
MFIKLAPVYVPVGSFFKTINYCANVVCSIEPRVLGNFSHLSAVLERVQSRLVVEPLVRRQLGDGRVRARRPQVKVEFWKRVYDNQPGAGRPGTDVVNFKIFSPKKSAKIWRFLLKTELNCS